MSKKMWAIALSSLLVGLFAYSQFIIDNNKELLSECAITTRALLERIYSEPRKGYSVVYSYDANGTSYRQNQGLVVDFDFRELFPGDSILIEYACEDSTVSRIIGK